MAFKRGSCKINPKGLSIGFFFGLKAMQPRIFVHFAAKRASWCDSGRTTPTILLSPACVVSTGQLEQLIGKQGNEAKHEMKPDFKSSPHHHVVGPEPLLQPT